MAKKYLMLVMSNADGNNNKFYELKLNEDDSVVARYGRVGADGVVEPKGYGEDTFLKVQKSKEKKGYRQVNIMTTTTTSNGTKVSGNLAEIAKRDIAAGDPVLSKLIDRLAQINRHQLLAASDGKIDIVDGVVKTPLGMVTLESVKEAQTKLQTLSEFVKNNDLYRAYTTTLEDYLTLVPQKIPSKRGWDAIFFTEFTTFDQQVSLLDQLETSIKNYQPPAPVVDDGTEKPAERVFGYKIVILDDDNIFNKIDKFYKSNINSRHVTKGYKLRKVYVLSNPDKQGRYETFSQKIGNVKHLWHGTRACNVLSIMKGGLIIPPTTGGNYTIAGRMFGNGVYFSDQSTKALNYATPYWSGGSKELDEIFMFHAAVAMGREYTPRGPTSHIPSGYDSIFAKAGESGVMNNEMIAPKIDQFKLDYLCEFVE
jgi:poly [ADP-ribose] polymerase